MGIDDRLRHLTTGDELSAAACRAGLHALCVERTLRVRHALVRLLATAFSATAILGAIFTFACLAWYPTVFGYMAKAFGPTIRGMRTSTSSVRFLTKYFSTSVGSSGIWPREP